MTPVWLLESAHSRCNSAATDWAPAVTAGITAAAALGGQAIARLLQGHNQAICTAW
jgi:hypothetical protein